MTDRSFLEFGRYVELPVATLNKPCQGAHLATEMLYINHLAEFHNVINPNMPLALPISLVTIFMIGRFMLLH